MRGVVQKVNSAIHRIVTLSNFLNMFSFWFKESGAFQDSAAATFNKLPVEIRNINNYRSFCHCIKEYLKNSE